MKAGLLAFPILGAVLIGIIGPACAESGDGREGAGSAKDAIMSFMRALERADREALFRALDPDLRSTDYLAVSTYEFVQRVEERLGSVSFKEVSIDVGEVDINVATARVKGRIEGEDIDWSFEEELAIKRVLDRWFLTDPEALASFRATATAEAFMSADITVTVLSDPPPSSGLTAVRIQPTTITTTGPQEVEMVVGVEGVTGLAAFDLRVGYDESLVEVVGAASSEFLASSDRGSDVVCTEPSFEPGSVSLSCVTIGPPVCAGGPAGASGSGTIATVRLRPLRVGQASLDLRGSQLVADDLQPCDPALGEAFLLPSVAVDAEILVTIGE